MRNIFIVFLIAISLKGSAQAITNIVEIYPTSTEFFSFNLPNTVYGVIAPSLVTMHDVAREEISWQKKLVGTSPDQFMLDIWVRQQHYAISEIMASQYYATNVSQLFNDINAVILP